MIPKIIHQIWIGPKVLPSTWMNTWKISGFEYNLWTENNINSLDFTNRKKYEYYYSHKRYDCAADILRICILNAYGGLYIDADMEKTKPFPEEWLNYDFLAVQVRTNVITNAVIGCSKKSNIIKNYEQSIQQVNILDPCMERVGALLLSEIIYTTDTLESINILPGYTFFPKDYRNVVNPQSEKSIAIHHYGSTFGKYLRKKR